MYNEKVDCIGCGACSEHCGLGLDPCNLMKLYNDFLDGKEEEVKAALAEYPEGKGPDRCFGCGACQFWCPQKIDIWHTMGTLVNLVK
ncbi:MAG: 4Fe-4S dicluster domain-containing protein [Clostridia bacterium]|nr:4Fe-4S dicluster domain-containing protein [Clostridia bacterium]